ncbi:MRG/MORF4L-binding protein-like [Culex pipiens pallens]|uniref:MRG/MORF4L-binding protein-like n=1 Tax=Culex pipiens pallens TaxID=42434 RepID=UPI0022AAC503|nr:MRG/MORF4L-binding protein-like [Culex pipiens pallens]
MATVREKTDNESLEWSPEDEIQLFFAMDGLRPVGINRHFFIACVVERLSKALNREVSSESVWSHLGTMYNLQALDEQDPLPFPNEETDFSLPEADYPLDKKRKSIEEQQQPADEAKKVEVKPDAAVKVTAKEKEPADKEKDKPAEKEKEVKQNKPAPVDNTPKRPPKRTRGSLSLEPNASSPASTPPNVQSTKRRRI